MSWYRSRTSRRPMPCWSNLGARNCEMWWFHSNLLSKLKKPRLIGGNLSIQEIGLGCNRTGRQKKCHALPNKFFWLCNIGFQASETLASCWGHFCEWHLGEWTSIGKWLGPEQSQASVASHQIRWLRFTLLNFGPSFQWYFQCFTFCIFFLWMQFLCIYDCPCISAASALVKILFQTQVWE